MYYLCGYRKSSKKQPVLFFGNTFDREAQIRETRQNRVTVRYSVQDQWKNRGIVVMKSVAGGDYFVHDFESRPFQTSP